MSNTRRLMFIFLAVLLAMLLPVNQDFSQGATSLATRQDVDKAQAGLAAPDQVSLTVNGSFESGCTDPGASFVQLNAGDTCLPGWVVLPVNIHYVGSGYWEASDGSRSLDLDGAVGAAGGIRQTFSTTPGTRYKVSFDLAGNPESGPTIKSMRVSADGQSAVFNFDITGKTVRNMGWRRQTWTFTADDSSATLQFVSLNGSGWGPALDNVSVPMPVATVSAASFIQPPVAKESIVATFGEGLATGTQSASTLPLPTMLAGTTANVIDSLNKERSARIFFVSPAQINYQVPPETANGLATIAITSGNGIVSYGAAQIETVAPGLFSANTDGQGVPAGYVLRIKPDGSQVTEPIARFDPSQNKYVPLPIDLGAATDQVFLILFGTGIRYRSSLSTTMASIGGTNVPVLYAGQQSDFVGLDQVNLSLPRTLAGRNEVDLVFTADGKAANTVRLSFK
ncbi:MAG: choice-of-anchor C family protein [Acidobacteria bacterium]|nr:choice-of-anchor C family protein [Acidobacteriota bacterium]